MVTDRGVRAAQVGSVPWRSLVVILTFILIALGALTVLLAVGGHDVPRALSALVEGAFGSWNAFLSGTCLRATPIMLAGLAVAMAFRGGVINIGADGQLLAGAAAGTAVALGMGERAPQLSVVAILVSAAVGGGLCAAVPALLRRFVGVLEVITTLMLNFVTLHFVGYLVRGPLQEPTHIYPQSMAIPSGAQLPPLVPGSRLHIGFALAIAACVAAWWVLRTTAVGFRVRAMGESPTAAAVAGRVDVPRLSFWLFVASGMMAGIAGGIEVSGVTYALYDNLSPGWGFTAIAVALLARLHPLGVVLTALALGSLGAGAAAMQREAGVPLVITQVVEALLILSVVAMSALQRRRLGAF